MTLLFSRRACLSAGVLAPFASRSVGLQADDGVPARPPGGDTEVGVDADRPRPMAPRVVALDWGWVATLIGLGLVPVGVAEMRLYRDWVGAPPIPDGAVEVGLRTDPSLDTLAALRPDLILTNALNGAITPRLENIAPTLANPTYSANRTPLANATAAARWLGERLSRPAEAAAMIDDAASRISRARDRLHAWKGRALLPFSVIDRRHLTIYGNGSLFVDVLRAVGLDGLWPGATSLWGSKTIAVADLLGLPSGDMLAIDPAPAAAAGMFDPAGLFARLCVADQRAFRRLPAVWGFGDISAAARFADLLAAALEGERPT